MAYELYLSSMADNGAILLEFYLLKQTCKNTRIEDGIEYCNLIIDAALFEPNKLISYDELEKFEKIKTIQKYHTHEQLLNYMKLATKIKDVLLNISRGDEVQLSEEKVRSYQHFFNETSGIFLAAEMQKLRMRQELRQKLRN